MPARICHSCGTELSNIARFCPSCGKEVAAQVCESCGASVPEGSHICPNCEQKEVTRKTQEAALLAKKEVEAIAKEKARKEAEAVKEREKLEKEAARKDREAAVLAKKEAEAEVREKARREAEAIKEMEKQEKEAAWKDREAALLAKKEAEAEVREKETTSQQPAAEKEHLLQVGAVRRSPRLRNWRFIAGGIFSIFVLAGVVYVFTLGHSAPESDKATMTTHDTTTTPISETTTSYTSATPTSEATMLDTTTTAISEATTPDTTTTPITTTTPSQMLAEILARTAAITSVKYDTLVTRPGTPTATTRTWVKNSKMRIETTVEGEAVVILVNGDTQTVYRYVPAKNTATKMPYSRARTAMQDAESIVNYNPSVVSTTTMDGKDCMVVAYLEGGASTRMWLWQDYGFPLRVEKTVPAGITIVESVNIDFADIPDSIFELPPGASIVKPSTKPPL